MDVLRVVLLIVEVLVSLMLAAVILVQQSKSQGLGMAFGGGMGESLFGSRAGNVLTKTTIILGAIFLLNTTVLGILFSHRESRSIVEDAPVPAAMPQQAQMPSPGGAAPSAPAMPAQPPQGTLVIPDQPVAMAPQDDGVVVMPMELGEPLEAAPPQVTVETAPVVTDEQPEALPQP